MKHLSLLLALLLTTLSLRAQDGDTTAQWNKMTDQAIAFLRTAQSPDGSWSGDKQIGITGIVVTALLQSGKVPVDDPMVKNALGYIEKLINSKEGHLAGENPKQQLKNYVTAVNVMALAAANKDGKYTAVIDAGAKFLMGLQWDEGEGKTSKDLFYGGFGYDSKNRPDMSNSGFALEALHAAGVPQDNAAFKKATIFLSRSQNLKGEHQDQPWAGQFNDGSFIYNPMETKANANASDASPGPGYASITYAGIKSMIYAGVDKNDRRVQEALKWVKKNYSMELNVGMPKERGKQGLYYGYNTMTKAFRALELDELVDDQGNKHNWRKDLIDQLAKTQKANGSWSNDTDRWMEGDANLVTAFALLALDNAKK